MLTDTEIRKVKPSEKPKKISDDGGLFLLVTPQGSKLWRLAYRFSGKQKTLAIGEYPSVSLADARAKREEAKKQLANGIDPSMAKPKPPTALKSSPANGTLPTWRTKPKTTPIKPPRILKKTLSLGWARCL